MASRRRCRRRFHRRQRDCCHPCSSSRPSSSSGRIASASGGFVVVVVAVIAERIGAPPPPVPLGGTTPPPKLVLLAAAARFSKSKQGIRWTAVVRTGRRRHQVRRCSARRCCPTLSSQRRRPRVVVMVVTSTIVGIADAPIRLRGPPPPLGGVVERVGPLSSGKEGADRLRLRRLRHRRRRCHRETDCVPSPTCYAGRRDAAAEARPLGRRRSLLEVEWRVATTTCARPGGVEVAVGGVDAAAAAAVPRDASRPLIILAAHPSSICVVFHFSLHRSSASATRASANTSTWKPTLSLSEKLRLTFLREYYHRHSQKIQFISLRNYVGIYQFRVEF